MDCVSNPMINCDDSFNGSVDEDIPIIDFSILISHDTSQRFNEIQKLGKACVDYGFFSVINHKVPESLIKSVIDALFGFFDLPEEEKHKYETNNPTDTIRRGKGDLNHIVSRDYFKIAAHPHFHCPSNPSLLREVLKEYHKRVREVGLVLLRGISKTLGLEEFYIEKAMKLESGSDIFTANDYPPRQQSENRMGQFPHCDPGFINLLIQNVSGGLQIEHKGKWINADIQPYSIFVNINDHLEILTNGKYKSCIHQVVVNNEERRATLPLFIGPALDAFVSPAPEFVSKDNPPAYLGMTYKQYLEFNNKFHVIDVKSCIQHIRSP